MTTRDTTTGGNYEDHIQTLLETRSTHQAEPQVNVGKKRNGGRHVVDILLNKTELISLKYQEVQGTAEEKIPFEIMKLQHMVIDGGYKSATIVLAGPDKAWNWKEYYLGNEFQEDMKKIYPDVTIMSHESFLKKYLNLTEGEIKPPQGLTQWIQN